MSRSHNLYRFLVVMLTLSITFLSGCAKPPTMEIENAEKALAEAKQKEADLYVEDVFLKAEESLKRAKDLVAVKKYKEAKKAAGDVVILAQQAISMVGANRAKMKADAEQKFGDVREALDELKSLATRAIKKKASINRAEIQSMIGKWELDLVNAKDQLQLQQIRQAYGQLRAIQKEIKTQKKGLVTVLEPKATDRE